MAINKTGTLQFARDFPTEIVQRIASYLDLPTLLALSCVDKDLYGKSNPPRLYVRNRVHALPSPPGLNLHQDARERLKNLAIAYAPRWFAAMQSAEDLRLMLSDTDMSEASRALLNGAAGMGARDARETIREHLESFLTDIANGNPQLVIPLCKFLDRAQSADERDKHYPPAMEAYASLLRKLGRFMADHDAKVRARVLDFSKALYNRIFRLLDSISKENNFPTWKTQTARVLFGELLRSFGRTCNWDQQRMHGLQTKLVDQMRCLYKDEWDALFAVAVQQRHQNFSYTQLIQMQEPKAKAVRRNSMPVKPVDAGIDRDKIAAMPVAEALSFFAKNFAALLERPDCDEILARLMRRWSQHWHDDPAAALNMHADFLRGLAPAVFMARQGPHKKLLEGFMKQLQVWMDSLLFQGVGIACDSAKEKDALERMVGEMLRLVVLGSPTRKQSAKALNERYRNTFVDVGRLITSASWDKIVQLALSHPREALSYEDLKRASQAQAETAKQEDEESEKDPIAAREKCTVS